MVGIVLVIHISFVCSTCLVNYVVEASVPTIILFCVIHEDVDDLYKWQMYRPSSLHQRQISHEETSAI